MKTRHQTSLTIIVYTNDTTWFFSVTLDIPIDCVVTNVAHYIAVMQTNESMIRLSSDPLLLATAPFGECDQSYAQRYIVLFVCTKCFPQTLYIRL